MTTPVPAAVLIVDDLPANRRLYRLLVEETGCQVVEAASGPGALARCRDQDFVMVLLDVHLGTPDGFETARLIRGLPNGNHLPIVFVSAVYTEDRDNFRGHEAGAVDYLIAPVVPVILQAKVKVFKAQWEREQELLAQATELARLNRCLSAMTEEIDTFTDLMAHDLRVPFRHINGFAHELLQKEGSALAPESKYLLDRILEAGERGSRTLEELLSLGRTTAALVSERVEVDLSSLAARHLQTFTNGDPFPVDLNVEPGLTVRADPKQAALLLEQLLANAVKFSRPKGEARIRVGRMATPQGEAFFVADEGVGFEPSLAKANLLFHPLRRLHGKEFPGSGMGLAVAKRIVTRHGGAIWAESRPGQGATFFFRLE